MSFKMKNIGKVKHNCFEISIEYTHANGCIDFKTFNKQILETTNQIEIEKFIQSFNKISNIISHSKDEGDEIPTSLQNLIKKHLIKNEYLDIIEVPDTSLYVIVKQDYTDDGDGEGDYTIYAEMNIKKIVFIDNEMNMFEVSF